jgi:hypothetical protein
LFIAGAISVFWTRRIISSKTESESSFRRFSNTEEARFVVSTRHVTASLRTWAICSLSREITLLRRRREELGADKPDDSVCWSISRTAFVRWARRRSRASERVRLSSRMMASRVSERVYSSVKPLTDYTRRTFVSVLSRDRSEAEARFTICDLKDTMVSHCFSAKLK